MNLNGLPDQARQAVKLLVETLSGRLDENLLSLTLVGSVLSGEYCPKRSDINSVLVVRHNAPEILDFMAEIGPKMGRQRLSAPLLMWPEYIRRSCDVFAVEWLDYQWRHLTVVGDDPFAELRFEKRDVRLQCEREYKSALVRLRQGYIRSARKPALIAELLAAAARELAPYLRATLWLADGERPAEAAETFERLGAVVNVSLEALARRYAGRYEIKRPSAEAMQTDFGQVCKAVGSLADYVDKLEV